MKHETFVINSLSYLLTLIQNAIINVSLIMVHEMTCHNLYNPQSLGSISWDIHTTYDFQVTKVLVSLAFTIYISGSISIVNQH